jgi:hypothetical protein
VSERRNLEYVTKTGRGAIHTPHNSDTYRDGWERTFGKQRDNNDAPDESKESPDVRTA